MLNNNVYWPCLQTEKAVINAAKSTITSTEYRIAQQAKQQLDIIFFCVGVVYSGEYDVCDVTPSGQAYFSSLPGVDIHSVSE